MRIVIVTDTWEPDVNGVVRTIKATNDELRRLGHEVVLVEPSLFSHVRCPLYPELRLAFGIQFGFIEEVLRPPCAVHIATEGPVGFKFSAYCARHKIPYTTAYHTNFPEYLSKYAWIPQAFSFSLLRNFHSTSSLLLVATGTLETKLKRKGFRMPMAIWSRGVDLTLFRPRPRTRPGRPVALCVGRVAREKNIDAFLDTAVECDKWVVGDGPYLGSLKKRYPNVHYLGCLQGEELAAVYAQADVLVFPSKTDTFGLVMIEALASGVPVAAYPVAGPIDVIPTGRGVGHLADNLAEAIRVALQTHVPEACRSLALRYTWRACTEQFVNSLVLHPLSDAQTDHTFPEVLLETAQQGGSMSLS